MSCTRDLLDEADSIDKQERLELGGVEAAATADIDSASFHSTPLVNLFTYPCVGHEKD